MFANVESKPICSIPRTLGRAPRDRDPSRVLLPACPIVNATCTGVLIAALGHLQPLREGGWKPVVVVGATLLCSVPEGTADAFVEPMLTAARAALDEVGVHLPQSLVTVAAREAWGSSTPSGTSRNPRRSQGDDGRNP